ncbi:hypothetical protein FB451DRAFT_1167177 [Mycena latifolia]|nr:hypothetical protein FB451DRAFT_1167177 [Mycena latifolia]
MLAGSPARGVPCKCNKTTARLECKPIHTPAPQSQSHRIRCCPRTCALEIFLPMYSWCLERMGMDSEGPRGAEFYTPSEGIPVRKGRHILWAQAPMTQPSWPRAAGTLEGVFAAGGRKPGHINEATVGVLTLSSGLLQEQIGQGRQGECTYSIRGPNLPPKLGYAKQLQLQMDSYRQTCKVEEILWYSTWCIKNIKHMAMCSRTMPYLCHGCNHHHIKHFGYEAVSSFYAV